MSRVLRIRVPRQSPLLRWLGYVAILATSAAASAQLDKPLYPEQRVRMVPAQLVTVRAAGPPVTQQLSFEVTPGFHINSNKPTSELLVPTVVKLDPPTNISVGGLRYPAGRDMSFPFSPKDKLNVYTGDFTVTTLVTAARNTPSGRFRVHGLLQYQACDDRACYPPSKIPVAFDVKVLAPARKARRNPAQSPHVHR